VLYAGCRHAVHTFLCHRFDLQQHFHWVGAGERGHYRRRTSATLFAIRADDPDAELICAGGASFFLARTASWKAQSIDTDDTV
jgi:hypothetical protein